MSTPKYVASFIGMLALIMFLSTWLQYSRGQEFNAAPPQEETWQAAIYSNTWDDSIAIDAPCTVRSRSAMQCWKGCNRSSITLLQCGGRKLNGAGMMWNRAAGTLILESSSGLEPRRLALKLAPTPTVVVDPHCRATLRDAIGFDATPACGYAYLETR